MKRKLFALGTGLMLLAGTAFYGFSYANKAEAEKCELAGTADCPKVKDCPLAGTPECPYAEEDCCAKK